jgi:hypothetical protein
MSLDVPGNSASGLFSTTLRCTTELPHLAVPLPARDLMIISPSVALSANFQPGASVKYRCLCNRNRPQCYETFIKQTLMRDADPVIGRYS